MKASNKQVCISRRDLINVFKGISNQQYNGWECVQEILT